MKHTMLMALSLVGLLLLAEGAYSQVTVTRATLRSGDTLVPGQTYWAKQPVILTDSTSSHRLIAYTIGGGDTVAVSNDFRVVALVYKDHVPSDTMTVGTVTSSGNASAVVGTKTFKELQNHWIPPLSGADSTAIWYLRASGGFQVLYGLKSYSSHVGGQKTVLVLDTP
jgi:hypothetical protein